MQAYISSFGKITKALLSPLNINCATTKKKEEKKNKYKLQ